MDELEALRRRWLQLIRQDLPEAARSRPDWPVRLDHCFARIILDNICGRPWREVLPPPAYRALDADQLRAAIQLGEAILQGADLKALNDASLRWRRRR